MHDAEVELEELEKEIAAGRESASSSPKLQPNLSALFETFMHRMSEEGVSVPSSVQSALDAIGESLTSARTERKGTIRKDADSPDNSGGESDREGDDDKSG